MEYNIVRFQLHEKTYVQILILVKYEYFHFPIFLAGFHLGIPAYFKLRSLPKPIPIFLSFKK